MTDNDQICEVFVTVGAWIHSQTGQPLTALKGKGKIWQGDSGDWRVRFNPERAHIENVPPLMMLIEHKRLFLTMCFADLKEGLVIGCDEQEILEHFRSRTPDEYRIDLGEDD